MRASTAPMLKRISRIAANVEKNRRGSTFSAPHVNTSGVSGKGGGMMRGDSQRHRALVADPAPEPIEVPPRDQPVESDVARLVADPEGDRRAERPSRRRQASDKSRRDSRPGPRDRSTSASMPNGIKNTGEASSAPRTKGPHHVRKNSEKPHLPADPVVLRLDPAEIERNPHQIDDHLVRPAPRRRPRRTPASRCR